MSQLLQNAAYGTALILAAAVLRWALRDHLIPEVRLALWAVCLFRLLTPVALESTLSLWGLPRLFAVKSEPAAPVATTSQVYIPAATVPAPQPEPGISWETVLSVLWLAVGVALAVRYMLNWKRTHRAVSYTIPVERSDPRYTSLPSYARLREGPMEGAPLTFGAVRPTVVLSPGLEGKTLDCVLAHESVHARRRDNLWHYVMALTLVVHWWNPAVWLMSRLLRRDIELSCDRAAVKKLGTERRAEYANALVSLATQTEGPAFCQTFGRKAAEERILSVMKFKKTSIIGVIFSLALVLALTAAFASEPKEPESTFEVNGITLTGDAAEYARQLHIGMTRDEVLQLLGEPHGMLSGMYGDIYIVDKLGDSPTQSAVDAPAFVIYYDGTSTNRVIHVRYRTEDGQAVDLISDEDATTSSAPASKVFPYAGDSPALAESGFNISGFDSVKYFPIPLDAFLDGLAQQVENGYMTQAEADQRIDSLLELMKLESLSDIKVTEGNVLLVYASRYDYFVGGYTFAAVMSDMPSYVEEREFNEGALGVLQGEGNIVCDEDLESIGSRFYSYKVNLPTFDEDGNSVAADGAIIGTRYELCTLEDCDVTGSHAHVDDKVIKVDYQDPYTGSTQPPATIPDPVVSSPVQEPEPICPVEGCTIFGSHTHNGVNYACNGSHSGGHCDGSCPTYRTTYPSTSSGSSVTSGHHGSNHH